MPHIMVDLETLGLDQDAAILSIGAVSFDIDATTVAPLGPLSTDWFYEVVDLGSAIDNGHIDASVLRWWMDPKQEAPRRIIFDAPNTLPLHTALSRFAAWLKPDDIIWSHGLTFDVAILQHRFRSLGLKWPLHYRNARDTRTLFVAAGATLDKLDDLVPNKPAEFVQHHATWDAWYQAMAVQAAYRRIKRI